MMINISYVSRITKQSFNTVISFLSFLFKQTENNLMGAGEWAGYSNSTPSYTAYSSTQSNVPPPLPPPPTSTSYGYDSAGMLDHSNCHIPTGKHFNFY